MLRSTQFDFVREAVLDLVCTYFRVEVTGLRNVPRQGSAVIIANHSGYSAVDAIVLAHVIRHLIGRRPRIMAHRGYFDWIGWLRETSFMVGLREPNTAAAMRTLRHGHLLIVFPEGERGNFKSSFKRYRLQPFHSGFAGIALRANVPIVPCVITGAEEAHLCLGSISLGRVIKGLRIPIPLNLWPLPSKWRIRFLKPGTPRRMSSDPLAERYQRHLQAALNRELRNRAYVFLPHWVRFKRREKKPRPRE